MDDDTRPCIAEKSPAPMVDQSRTLLSEENRAHVTEASRPLADIPDDDLLRRLGEILTQSRRCETDLVAHIAEVDERRLYTREAFASMFAYCTGALHLSEGEAYLRIAAARASRDHPALLTMLGDGRLHLSGIAVLAPHLTPENRETLLRRATHRSKREILEIVAEVAPQQDVPALMRKLPERTPSPAASTLSGMGISVTPNPAEILEGPHGPASVWIFPEPALASPAPASVSIPPSHASTSVPPGHAPAAISPDPVSIPPAASLTSSLRPVPAPVVQPLSPGRYKVQFTASAQLRDKLERLQALMRSRIPDGNLAAVIEAVVTEKLERLEARHFAATKRPRTTLSNADTRPDSRYIPAALRRAVRERDGNRCRFVDKAGRRCEERRRLLYHHVYPFGVGGDHRLENIRLVCKPHNDYLAEVDYGRKAMARFTGRKNQARTRPVPRLDRPR